jgi:hypothetical protein
MTENAGFFGSLTQNAAVPMAPSITMIEQRRMLNERVRLHVNHLEALVQTLKNLGIGDAAINDQVAGDIRAIQGGPAPRHRPGLAAGSTARPALKKERRRFVTKKSGRGREQVETKKRESNASRHQVQERAGRHRRPSPARTSPLRGRRKRGRHPDVGRDWRMDREGVSGRIIIARRVPPRPARHFAGVAGAV